MWLTDTQKIGVGLTAFGLFFMLMGVMMFFDGGLLAIGNIIWGDKEHIRRVAESKKRGVVAGTTIPALEQVSRLWILFLAGLTLVIGTQKTIYFFARRQKIRGTICFFGGIFLVFIKWPIIGVFVELFGFINLFGDFFPVIVGFLRRLPVIGNILSAPGISKIVDRMSGQKLPV